MYIERVIACLFFLIYIGRCEDCSYSKHGDVVFVIDGSGSMGTYGFQKSLELASSLVESLDVGSGATRVGLLVFDVTAHVEFHLNTHSSKANVKKAILSAKYPDGGTDIPQAIQATRQTMFTVGNGRRSQAIGVAVVITDGRSYSTYDTETQSRLLREAGVTVYAIGISGYETSELHAIASQTDYVFELSSFDKLVSIDGPLQSVVCTGVDGCICFNGGRCAESGTLGYRCQCSPGYTGTHCDTNIDECASDPCLNGATCKDWINAFSCTCPPRYYGDLCETGICQPTVADVIFVLDSSVSQSQDEFTKQLEFVTQFIDHIVVSKEAFQIAVITYSFDAKVEIGLNDYHDNITLKDAVRNITFRPGATFTHTGLDAVTSVLDLHKPRPNYQTARRYVFLLTDGLSTYRQETKSAADALKRKVTKVIAVGIGKQVSHRELLDVASPGDGASPVYVFSVENFNSLYSVVKQLVHITCDECLNGSASDIVFLLDSGPTMSAKNFQSGIDAVSYLIETMIGSETDKHSMRTGLITYDTSVTTKRTFTDGMTKQQWLPYLQRLVQPEMTCLQDHACASSDTIGNALDEISKSFKTNVTNNSNDSRQFLIILTNGQNTITSDTESRLVLLRKDGVYVFVIGCGPDAQMSSLLSLVTDPNNVFLVEAGVQTTHLDVLMAQFMYDSCTLTNNF